MRHLIFFYLILTILTACQSQHTPDQKEAQKKISVKKQGANQKPLDKEQNQQIKEIASALNKNNQQTLVLRLNRRPFQSRSQSAPAQKNQEKNGTKKSIRFGLSAIKGVGAKSIKSVVNIRKNEGKFKSSIDFLKRVANEVVNKRQLEKFWESWHSAANTMPEAQAAKLLTLINDLENLDDTSLLINAMCP